MIIKDYFSDGLLQIAIILSLLRSDLDSFLDVSPRPSPVRSHLLEINDGPLSGITRTDLNYHSREFVREYPKVLDSYSSHFSPFLRDLHSLSYYRRFDGISTSVHAWLLNEGGTDGCSSSCERSTGDDADDTNTTSQDVSSVPAANELSVLVSEPDPTNLFFEDELSKEDMELINILYLQDIDLGVGREVFDDLCSNTTAVSAVEQKELESNKTLSEDNKCDCHNVASIGSAQPTLSTDSCPTVDSSPQYVVDTETGELVLASRSSVSSDSADDRCDQQSDCDVSAAATENTLTHGDTDDDSSHTEHQQNYDRQSSYDERWEDMMSVLDLQSVLETDSSAYMDTEWDGFSSQNNASSSSLALMHNVSMTQPVVSSAAILSPAGLAGVSMLPPVTYDLAEPVSSDTSLPFFQPGEFEMSTAADFAMAHVNLTCETPLVAGSDSDRYAIAGSIGMNNYTYDAFDSAVSSRSAGSDNFNYSTTLLTTLEHYSSASAALNRDLAPTHVSTTDELLTPPLSTNLSDTNALFQQLLRANLLLEELDLDNSSFLNHNVPAYDSWSSSADSAVSSMHSPTLESAVDVPTGASGYADDMPPKYSDIAATASAGDDVKEFGRGMRLSASNASASNSSFGDRHSSTSSDVDQKNVEHNHTYPLRPGQSRRRDQEDRDERASRSRDEKKAKDMHIPLTMEEMIDSSVELFNELLSKYKLSDAQYQLIRDIRRRGKNKLAAQNCRKRKLEVIQTVEDEMLELRRERDKLLHEKSSLEKHSTTLKHKLSLLEAELFRRLHNETGQDYDPSRFSVLQTDDGRVFIVSRDSSAAHDEPNKRRKKKPDKKD